MPENDLFAPVGGKDSLFHEYADIEETPDAIAEIRKHQYGIVSFWGKN